MYHYLITPFWSQSLAQRCYIVLPPDCHNIPFAACFDGYEFFIQQTDIIYLSTPEAILRVNRRWYTDIDIPESQQIKKALVIGISDQGRLIQALQEAEQVNNILQGNYKTDCLLECSGTEAAFRANLADKDIIHLATHAVYRPDNPMFSWIQLHDGRITVSDLHHIILRKSPLVVLSACETGQGQARGGGLLGMGRGFLSAGASGLILTLWPLVDHYATSIMASFYHQFVEPETGILTATALGQAQRQAIQAQQHPYYWAAYINLAA